MPVVLLGGEPFVARAVASAMLAVSPEVRAMVGTRDDANELRALGAKVAVGEPDDVDLLDVVLSGAHTLCLLGAPFAWDGRDAGHDVVERTLERARSARIQRILAVVPAVAEDGDDVALGPLAEESGLPAVVVRTNLVFGAGSALFDALAAMARARPAAQVVGAGSQRWAPVFVDDLARVLAAADDRSEVVSGTFGLDGPDVVTADELADLLAGKHRSLRRHLNERAVRNAGGGISPAAVRSLSGDILAGPPSAAQEFGVALTPLPEALARSLG